MADQPVTATAAGAERTRRIIMIHEGFVGGVYDDAVGKATIGYGHLMTAADKELHGKVLTEVEAGKLLDQDIAKHEAEGLKGLTVPITENQRSALVSLAFNVGPGAIRNIVKLMNEGKVQQAADRILKYDKAKDKTGEYITLKGLTKRREYERELFLTSDSEHFDEGKMPAPRVGSSTPDPLAAVSGIFSAGPDAALGQNQMILAAMKDLNRQLGQDSDFVDYLNRLRSEGGGIAQ